MKIPDRAIRAAFWILDRAHGRSVGRELECLEEDVRHPELQDRKAQEGLDRLIQMAISETAHYARLRGASRLEDFPVLTKLDLQAKLDEMIARSADRSALREVFTSGSSGAPSRYFHGPRKRSRKLAELIHYNRFAGYELGMRHMLIRTTPRGRLSAALRNQVWVDPTRLDETFLAQQEAKLRGGGISVLIGHPSVIVRIARLAIARAEHPARFGVVGVIGTSEGMTEPDRKDIKQAFGCPVLARYATEEFGIVAHELPDADGYVVNRGGFVVEVLETGSERAVAPGEVGRVVVTDLFSNDVPLIRFDTGDLAVAGEPAVLGVQRLERIEGKRVQMISDPDGVQVSPHALVVAMKDVPGVHEFQFIQIGAGRYDILIRASGTFDGVDVVAARARRILGRRAAIRIRRVDAIPRMPSGKRSIVRNAVDANPAPPPLGPGVGG